jgi:hypothetical protein
MRSTAPWDAPSVGASYLGGAPAAIRSGDSVRKNYLVLATSFQRC